jgi:hypothetical protein
MILTEISHSTPEGILTLSQLPCKISGTASYSFQWPIEWKVFVVAIDPRAEAKPPNELFI